MVNGTGQQMDGVAGVLVLCQVRIGVHEDWKWRVRCALSGPGVGGSGLGFVNVIAILSVRRLRWWCGEK